MKGGGEEKERRKKEKVSKESSVYQGSVRVMVFPILKRWHKKSHNSKEEAMLKPYLEKMCVVRAKSDLRQGCYLHSEPCQGPTITLGAYPYA